VLEDVLTRGLKAENDAEMRAYMEAALDLSKDMKFFLIAAQNLTSTEDSYTSMGKVRADLHQSNVHEYGQGKSRFASE